MKISCDLTVRSTRYVASIASIVLLACGWAGGAVPAAAQTEMQVDTQVHRALLEAPVGLNIEDDTLPVSLERAVEIALQRNLGLVIQRYNRERTALSVFGNKGIYDLGFRATVSTSDQESATANEVQSGSLASRRLNMGVQQLVETGGQLSFGWNNSRSESSNEFVALRPEYNAFWDFNFDQPLPFFQGFGSLVTERQLRISRLDSRISLATFEQEVISTVQAVEQAYWRLIDAQEQLQVAEESLDLARELHERNKIEVEVGTRAPLELVQSEATIATRDEQIIQAQQTLGDAQDQVRRLLNLPTDLWEVPLRLTSEARSEPRKIDLEEAVRTAYSSRPEVRSQELSIEQAEIDSIFQRNQKRPRLDLSLNYNLGGVAGVGRLEDPSTGELVDLDTDLSDALQQIFNQDAVGWSIGVTFAYPLQNRSARATSLQANLVVDQEELRLEDLRRQILTEVRSAVRQVNSAAQQITSAEVSRRLQERNLDAEQKRYENGMSTSFQVTEIQEDLTQARTREVSALTAYRIALAEYHRSIGRLLEEFDIEIVDPFNETGRAIGE